MKFRNYSYDFTDDLFMEQNSVHFLQVLDKVRCTHSYKKIQTETFTKMTQHKIEVNLKIFKFLIWMNDEHVSHFKQKL